MKTYVILEDVGSSTLIEKRQLFETQTRDPGSVVVEEFEADCWCLAMIYYKKQQGHADKYDPCWYRSPEEPRCPHYKKAMSEMSEEASKKESYPVVRQGTDTPIAWECAECHRLYNQEVIAERCCVTTKCECGADAEIYYTACSSCRKKHANERLRGVFAKAHKVSVDDYAGEQVCTPDGSEFTVPCEVEWTEVAESETPWMWGTTSHTLRLDARDILESALDDWFEDAAEHFDEDDLQAKLNEWCKHHETVKCYWPDEGVAVVHPSHPALAVPDDGDGDSDGGDA